MSGIAGFFIKPITGMIDMTSKTAEGIKNDISHIEQRKRIRLPRFLL